MGKLVLVMSFAVSALMTTSCGLPPQIIESRHWELNETIRETTDEQLLLNLVRLRYDESPYFLQVSSISTQFFTGSSIGASGTFPSSSSAASSDVFVLDGSISYSEAPVVTWSLPDTQELFGRLLAPMGADQLTVLAQSGWQPDRVLQVGIKKMNRLRNLDYRIDQGVEQPDTYDEFLEVLRLIDELIRDDVIDLAYGVKSTVGAGKIPLDQLDTRAIPEGLQYGLQFMTREDPNVFEPLKLTKPLFLRFSRQSDADPRAQRLRALLNLDPEIYSFGIVDTGSSGTEQLLSESGKLSQAFNPDVKFKEIVLNNRSMMEVLRFASAYVQVPELDLSRGYARQLTLSDTNWLEVLSSPEEPADAWLKVQYRGSWFYIRANDLKSRSSFTLINALFASIVGEVPGAKPLLTLPVAR